MHKIRILHVSDAHFTEDGRGYSANITNELIKVAKDHVAKSKDGKPPHLVIFSGDLTQRGSRDQFENMGQAWLEKLIEDWPDCKLFIVPGNHDVDRGGNSSKDLDNAIHHALIQQAKASYDNYLRIREKILEAPLLDSFFEWMASSKDIETLPIINYEWDSKAVCRSEIAPCGENGPKCQIIGVNSALLSSGDDDLGRLVIDTVELNKALDKTNHKTQLTILVSHHPIGTTAGAEQERWFQEENNKHLQDIILRETGPHLYLHGHLHAINGVTLNYNTGNHITYLGAGAVYQNDHEYPNQFSFYELDMGTQKIKPSVYSYRPEVNSWNFEGHQSKGISGVFPTVSGSVEENRTDLKLLSNTLEGTNSYCTIQEEALDRWYKGMRRELPDNHRFVSVDIKYEIDLDGTFRYIGTYEITPNKDIPINAWQIKINARHDEGASPMKFPRDISFDVQVLDDKQSGQKVYPVFSKNKDYDKDCVLFLNPPIKPGESRKIQFSYTWVNGIAEFMTRKENRVEFLYTCSQPPNCICEFSYAIALPKTCLWVNAERQNTFPDDKVIDPEKLEQNNAILWDFKDKEFMFKREIDNEKRVFSFVLKNTEKL